MPPSGLKQAMFHHHHHVGPPLLQAIETRVFFQQLMAPLLLRLLLEVNENWDGRAPSSISRWMSRLSHKTSLVTAEDKIFKKKQNIINYNHHPNNDNCNMYNKNYCLVFNLVNFFTKMFVHYSYNCDCPSSIFRWLVSFQFQEYQICDDWFS